MTKAKKNIIAQVPTNCKCHAMHGYKYYVFLHLIIYCAIAGKTSYILIPTIWHIASRFYVCISVEEEIYNRRFTIDFSNKLIKWK